jgi:aspartate/methionine/tyrosine aminotransferase
MFAARTPADLTPNRLSRLLAAAPPRIDLTLANPTQAGIEYPGGEILAALTNPEGLRYQPDARGLPQARAAVAAHAGCAAEDVLLSGSTSEAYGWLFKLLCAPGDDVLVPRPSYPLFECLAELEGVAVRQYPLLAGERWAVDVDAVGRAIGPRTRAVIVVSPNNPTGSYLKRDEAAALTELCARHGLALIADEVFRDYGFADDARRAAQAWRDPRCLSFSLNGLSKSAGLPQLKVGWTVVGGPDELRRQALDRLEWIADAYLPLASPTQHAVARWLELAPVIRERIRARTAANLAALRGLIAPDSPYRLLEPEGGWMAIIEVPRIHSEEEWACRLLERDGVLVQPGYFYDFERDGYLVVSLLPEPEAFAAGIRICLDAVNLVPACSRLSP